MTNAAVKSLSGYLLKVHASFVISTSAFPRKAEIIVRVEEGDNTRHVPGLCAELLISSSPWSILSSAMFRTWADQSLHNLFTASHERWSLLYCIWKFFIQRSQYLAKRGEERVSKVRNAFVHALHVTFRANFAGMEIRWVMFYLFFFFSHFTFRKRSSPKTQPETVCSNGECFRHRSRNQRVHKLDELLQWIRNVS